jgi:predicted metal-dependent hydrolase
MTTRWGTCNTQKKKIYLNLQLAKKPIDCLEYVILHELVHLKNRNHDKMFVSIMDENMPFWREIRKKLNDQILDYYEPMSE